MDQTFQRFGLPHLAVLASVPAVALVLSLLASRCPVLRKIIPVALGVLLLSLEAGWFLWLINEYGWSVDYGLPLQLTDTTILLTGYVAIRRNQFVFDVIYYWSLSAMPLAMITPDLDAPITDLFSIVFFAAHGLTVVITLFLVWSRTMRPRPDSMWRSYVYLNVFAALVLVFNMIFDTNYMYLLSKPAQPSLLDWMGPWPFYILVADLLALLLFTLLWLPFRRPR